MNITVQNGEGNSLLVKLEGTLDVACQGRLKDELHKLGQQNPPRRLIVDLSHVAFIDSACLGVFVSLIKILKSNGGELFLVSPQDEVRSVFQITRLDRMFSVVDSLSDVPKA